MSLSWWPTKDLWAKSPFGERGYWPTTAEYWFQKCLQDLKDGKLKPRNASEGKKALAEGTVYGKEWTYRSESVPEQSWTHTI